jgi:hypothetical protein
MELTNISLMIKNLGGVISKNSPTILTGVAVAGLVSTTIMAIRATPKALSIVDNHIYDMYEEDSISSHLTFEEWLGVEEGYTWSDTTHMLTKKEIIQLTWREYVPATVLGLVTIGCIIGANHISLRRNAALASIYGITEAAFKEYQTKVIETIGANKETKIRDEISADRIKKNPVSTNEVLITGNGSVMCYDSLSGRYFRSDIEKIRRTVNELNYTLMSSMFLSINELYYKLGLPDIQLGEQMGWDVEKGMIEITFSTQLSQDGEPCLVLNYTVTPKYPK